MINLILFGKPGSGKGTQAEFVKKRYDLVHISTGDVFRYNISKNTDLGLLAKSYMEKGDLVPDQVTIKMLENEVEKFPKAKGFIFDGFPRTTTQAEILDDFLEEVLDNLNNAKLKHQKSADDKIFLTETKNMTGNTLSDNELLEFANLNKDDVNKKLKNLLTDLKTFI